MPGILDGQPEIYRDLLPEFLSSQIPEETKATCSSCAMCQETGCKSANAPTLVSTKPERFFIIETKCCTYHPNLPNFLVGAILAQSFGDDEKNPAREGKARMLKKITDRIGITPYGVTAPPKYNFLYQNSREFFGRSKAMLCPYYIDEQGGLCSVWAHREAVCSTYFCKYEAGADGRRFWSSLKSYLTLNEIQLARYATFQLYPEYVVLEKHPPETPARLGPEDLEDKAPTDANYKSLWGSWAGMEVEYYLECHRIVKSLSAADLKRLAGFDGEVALEKLKNAHKDVVRPTLPDRLKLNPSLSLQWLNDGSVAMGAYSELDALALGKDAYELLQEFDGREKVATVRAKLRKEKQSDFSDEVLLKIYQHRILVDENA